MITKREKKKEERLKKLQKLIEDLRADGKTYEELGAKAGVSSTTIHRIETGQTNPRIKTVNKVLDGLQEIPETKTSESRRARIDLEKQVLHAPPPGKIEDDLRSLVEDIVNILRNPNLPSKTKIDFLNSLSTLIRSYKEVGDLLENKEGDQK